jgi:hypothetical protein
MKTQHAKYTIPDSNGQPLASVLNYRKARKLTPALVQRKVAKTYGINPGHVTNIRIVTL